MATLGEMLREQRDRLGLSIQQAEEATRIRGKLLRALEDDDYEHLPNPGYVKGYVWSYAKFLELDPTDAVDRYRRQIGSMHTHEISLNPEPVVVTRRDQHAIPWRTALAVVAVIAVAALAVWGITLAVRPPEKPLPVPPAAEATKTPSRSNEASKPSTPAPSPEPTVSAEPTSNAPGPFKLVVAASGRSWIRIRIDGDVQFEGTLEDGDSKEYDVTEEASARIGAPSAVTITRNGVPVEIPDDETPVVVIKADEAP